MESYRHEFKYLCSNGELAVLKVRLQGLVRPDPHAGADGVYRIRSLYFDDYYDSCLKENESERIQERNSVSGSIITAQSI